MKHSQTRYHKKSDDAIVTALACGLSVEAAAKQCQLSIRTIYRRLQDPAFQARLSELRSDMVKRAASMLTAASSDAVRTLVQLQRESLPASVRLGAARAVLEIGLKVRDIVELETRIQQLEDIVAKRKL